MSSLDSCLKIGKMTAGFHTTGNSAATKPKCISSTIDGATISMTGLKNLTHILSASLSGSSLLSKGTSHS